jgi:hypothetical protein
MDGACMLYERSKLFNKSVKTFYVSTSFLRSVRIHVFLNNSDVLKFCTETSTKR